jgi:hypothetical protein
VGLTHRRKALALYSFAVDGFEFDITIEYVSTPAVEKAS